MRGRLQDGWLALEDVGGWEGHEVSVQAELIDGQPKVTGLHLEFKGDSGDPVITSARVRGLPFREMAALATRLGHMEMDPHGRSFYRQMASVARRKPPKEDRRAVTTVEQVADVHRLASASGDAARRQVVMDRLGISQSTADRYIKRAREQGLLPPVRPSAPTHSKKEKP